MKVLIEKYPKGSLPYQKTDGRYINDNLYENLKVMAKNIVDDLTFLGVIYSSTLEVGTGKSVFATQIGEVWTELMKDIHGIDVPFNSEHIVWRGKELIKKVLEEDENGLKKIPKYSFVLLDEWEHSTYWSELAMTMRHFFQKCRQLNLFIVVIIPNWFQFPMPYAIGRTIFAIDVRFGDDFERGFFYFYNFEKKRELYLNGRKTHNYRAALPNFDGRFTNGYGVDREEYLKAKAEDLKKWEEEEPKDKDYLLFIRIYTSGFMDVCKKVNFKPTQKYWGEMFKKSQQTISDWITKGKREGLLPKTDDNDYTNESKKKE